MSMIIDGTGSSGFVNSSSGTVALSTSLINDLIIIAVQVVNLEINGISLVNSITGGSLTFVRRKQELTTFSIFNPDDLTTTNKSSTAEVWYARANSVLSGTVFSITLTTNADICAIFAFGVNGVDVNLPFETFFGLLPNVNSERFGTSSNPQGSKLIETAKNNDMVLGFRFGITVPSGEAPGAGFSSIGSSDVSDPIFGEAHIYVEEQIVNSAYTFVSVLENQLLSYWTFFADVLTEIQPAPNPFPVPDEQFEIDDVGLENFYIAVEIDVRDRINNVTKVLRLCNQGPLLDEVKNQFFPSLQTPVLLGTRISADVYGQRLRGTTAGGDITFMVRGLEEWLTSDYHWSGMNFRVYAGISLTGVKSDLDLVFSGIISDVVHNFLSVSLKTADKSNLLNKPLLTDVYGTNFPNGTAGKIKPKLFGIVRSLEPVLEDEANLVYRITINDAPGNALDGVSDLRVGGVSWIQNNSGPGPGEYKVNFEEGTVQLGSTTLGGEVRVDARTPGWETFVTGDLLSAIVTIAGGDVDPESERWFSEDHKDIVGYYTGTDSHNVLDLLDEITFRQGGFWACGKSGKVLYKPLTYPTGPFINEADILYLSQLRIQNIQQSKLIPSIWRIRVEYAPNWNPATTFFTGVSEEQRDIQSASGIFRDMVPELYDPNVLDFDPAQGATVIRTLCQDEVPSYLIALRLFNGWKYERRLFEITAFCDPSLLKIYSTVHVKYGFINQKGLAHLVVMSLGAGSQQIQVWA